MKRMTVETNGVQLNIVEHGTGPAILLCHGFPESSRRWRRQIAFLTKAGYRAITPDLRSFSGSSAPEAAEEYTQLHIAGDLINLLDALGVEQATLIGHNWGAIAAWNAALHLDRFPKIVVTTGYCSVPIKTSAHVLKRKARYCHS